MQHPTSVIDRGIYDDVYAQIGDKPNRERWKVGRSDRKPTIEWIKQNTGIDPVRVSKVVWSYQIDCWVIVLLKSNVKLPEAANAGRYL